MFNIFFQQDSKDHLKQAKKNYIQRHKELEKVRNILSYDQRVANDSVLIEQVQVTIEL